MPSKASEGCRGGAARGGAAPPHGNNTFVPGFRNCCKRPTEAWTPSIAQPLAHSAGRRPGGAQCWGGAKPRPQRRTPSGRAVCAADCSTPVQTTGTPTAASGCVPAAAIPALSPEMRPVRPSPQGLSPNSRSESSKAPAASASTLG